MRILTTSFEFPPIGGGGSQVVLGLSDEFVKAGNEVDVITMAYRDLPKLEELNGVRVHRVPCIRSSVDVSHPHEQASYLFSALRYARKLAKERRFDIMHSHFIIPDGAASIFLKRSLDIPLVITAHGSDVPGYNPDRFKFLHRVISPGWHFIVNRIDEIVCPSMYLQSLIEGRNRDASTVVIPNGYYVDRLNPNKERKKRILVLTRMLERKGVQDVLHAMSKIDTEYSIDVVGTGPYLDTLVELDKSLGTGAEFHGWVENGSEEFNALFETSSIFIFPSRAENFPLVLLEAMAAGLAIITTDGTGCREVVGDTAIKVPAADPSAIAAAISRLSSDDDLRLSLGHAARERLVQKFSWNAVARSHLELFDSLITDNRGM